MRHWRPSVDIQPVASHEVAGLSLKSERLLTARISGCCVSRILEWWRRRGGSCSIDVELSYSQAVENSQAAVDGKPAAGVREL